MSNYLNILKYVGVAGLFYLLLMLEVYLLVALPWYRVVFCVIGAMYLAANYRIIARNLKYSFKRLRSGIINLF